MVEFSLPANSKVTTGITYKAKEPRESPKNLVIYRWNPEEKKNPRLDTYEIDQSKCGPMVLDGLMKIKNEIETIKPYPAANSKKRLCVCCSV